MSKLEGSSSLTRRKESQRPDRITTVGSRRNVTTGTSPTPIRLTPDERVELNLWVEELQGLTKKKLTAAKLMRGLIHMRKSINTGKLIEAIKDIT
ncbi:hypothetical protein [Aeromonas cavernicola]|uniref:Uncharacterized protein n=1 Tax=Aeromonas cavernicola TaxID=1006623 RepID=A0A2H9U1V6_9GAMM|nr:hypothetical protein [Aeromonas cavernicola]PJG58003.1 hypothetical protein CUC53_14915 [Aeromonas cavernicola]